jgi:hypothetical protein
MHFLFIDFKQAYGSINGTHSYKILKDPKEISEINKNDIAGCKWRSENPKSMD